MNDIKNDLWPVMKKARDAGTIAGDGVSIRGVSAAAGELTTTTYYNTFADLDAGNPAIPVVGQATAMAATAATLATNRAGRRQAARCRLELLIWNDQC